MSYLKKILVELENCVHDSEKYSGGVPVVWTREFQKKLSRNADHWNKAQRKKSHVGDMDFQDDTQVRTSYGNEEEEYGERRQSNYRDAYRKHMMSHEEEENKARTGLKTSGLRGDEADDCPDCFGTGMDFPRLKGDCATCKGSRKKAKEEDQEEEPLRTSDKGPQQRPPRREDNPDEKDPENVAVDDQYDLDDPNDQEDFGDEESELDPQHWDDPDYQGAIRTVSNAHLVYKRQQEDGTFHELWQYNLGDDFKKELTVRRAILAGTDIPINKMRSPDNSQSYELWTIGNGQLLQVKGLPN